MYYRLMASTTPLSVPVELDSKNPAFAQRGDMLRAEARRRFSQTSYRTPGGYEPLTHVTGAIADDVAFWITTGGEDVSYLYARLWLEENQPLFWLPKEFADACVRTDLPAVKISAMQWPRYSAMFLLPQSSAFTQQSTEWGADITLVACGIARVTPCILPPPGWMAFSTDADRSAVTLTTSHDGLLISCVVREELWDGKSPSVPSLRIADAAFIDSSRSTDDLPEVTTTLRIVPPQLMDIARRIALNAWLVMQERPELVESRQPIRKVSVGAIRRILWEPRWLGRKYRIVRPDGPQHGAGHHASPRMHWRNGHWRHQAHGPKRSERKLLWIEPCLINAKPDLEAAHA
jgi:hypothetical protein